MHKHLRPALAAAATFAAVAVTVPTASAAPKVPDGCTFDQATGRSTCVTETTVTSEVQVPTWPSTSKVTDGSGAGYLCQKYARLRDGGDASWYFAEMFYYTTPSPGAVVTSTAVKTTTTTFQGLSAGKGNKPLTTSTATSTTYRLAAGFIQCDKYPDTLWSGGYMEGPEHFVTITS